MKGQIQAREAMYPAHHVHTSVDMVVTDLAVIAFPNDRARRTIETAPPVSIAVSNFDGKRLIEIAQTFLEESPISTSNFMRARGA